MKKVTRTFKHVKAEIHVFNVETKENQIIEYEGIKDDLQDHINDFIREGIVYLYHEITEEHYNRYQATAEDFISVAKIVASTNKEN